jgi:hypothetical protein
MGSRGLTRVDAVVFVVVALVTVFFVMTVFVPGGHNHRPNQTKCANNLKQIALAAIQYSDDFHVFPHLGSQESLDGGYKSNTATRVLRTLVWRDYIDYPEVFICPSGPDQFNPLTEEARRDIKSFRWEGAHGPPAPVSPLAPSGADSHDVTLDKSTDLSYGWTRKAYSSNASAKALLAADKSRIVEYDLTPGRVPGHDGNMVGNHRDVMTAVCIDGHTLRIKPDDDGMSTNTIGRTDPSKKSSGFLGVLGDDASE